MGNQTPTLAFSLENDLRALAAMASNLTPYLYEKEMYGYLSGDLPRLTLGGILMRLYRLSHLERTLHPDQEQTVEDARASFDAARTKWAVHYDHKLLEELRARLNALEQYIEECREDLASCAAGYPSQAEKRVMIEHLQDEAETRGVLTDDLRRRIRQVDGNLRHYFREGSFITDTRLKDVYQPDPFWWMYGSLDDTTQ